MRIRTSNSITIRPPTVDTTKDRFTFNQTRDDIITRALRIIGALERGQDASSDMIEEGATALNAMVKEWENHGSRLWAIEKKENVSIPATGIVQVEEEMIHLDRAYLRTPNADTVIEINQIDHERDGAIYQKDAKGRPIFIWFQRKLTTADGKYLKLWPLTNDEQEDIYTLDYYYIRKLKDFDKGSTLPDFPERWIQALTWGLATDLSDEYVILPVRQQRIQAKAEYYFKMARSDDFEFETFRTAEGAYPVTSKIYDA